MADSIAISLKGVTRGYGKTKVIENLDLEIKKGSINSLIGASGSGKTTILRTILGRLVPDEGEVLLFGRKPFDSGCDHGRLIGYAPQENALYLDLSIDNTLKFFSNIHKMSNEDYLKRRDELVKLLDLPPVSRIVGTLSGGQKRRVSLAAALLHSPQLLICDEPTVGVDVMVSKGIWDHMNELAKSGVTIIITTHYIEEARQSDKVFLLRNGKILENGPPQHLIDKYDCRSLEEVFLQLCKADDTESLNLVRTKNNLLRSSEYQTPQQIINNDDCIEDIIIDSNYSIKESSPLLGISSSGSQNFNGGAGSHGFFSNFLKNIKQAFAIGKRKFTQIYRNKVVLSFELLSPTLQIVLYFLAIGGTPKNLNFGLVNLDTGSIGSLYVNSLQASGIFNFHNYNNTNDAIEQIKNGNSFGCLYIPNNFTMSLIDKLSNPGGDDPNWQIGLYMDYTNYQITLLVEQQLELSFESLAEQFNITLNPIHIEPAVYGDLSAKFIWFLAPGMVGLITFAHSIAITSVSFVREKIDGSLDRLFSYGVKTGSIVFGHFLGHLPLLLIQITVLLLIAIYGFSIPIKGNIVLVFLITVILAFVGMSLGLIISAVSTVETEAIQLSLGVYFPTLICSGTLWPIESIPRWFAWFPKILPATWAASALRDIMIKGVSLTYKEVWVSLLIIIAWFIALFTLSTMVLNEKDKNFTFFKSKKRN
ncbi:hypothetical protein DICPUDRAFT_152418 [Dictyostelium purpureum]|uniref:ABC transporter domain-containing protein n=1 Tax=Dictyostelium purpureum TaxID=5786 RepID=F0ZLB0_DICPU|nr:uncharacterized protein DICPUDRAFT_152418 [Dictyostelium purpureum]EGC35283.1 hypothetical protein DICPUDRAFT_152418 [Dictyostelium purpureum]|eukprot:XP_003288209.1 hypothetical protein DICPUDRAFT_152418 [Dictyostelium purpureum]